MQRPGVTAPIIAARTLAHFNDNMGACGWSLTDEQMDRLTQASDKPLPYPFDFLKRVQR
jgi:aryl-alcohol dehydrogenase-like predicted oxidoreductase